ncbi:MAG: formylglycine-generating enzyme family protein [Acidobacteria bacterium]|nr:formylglycine-generating enzyme family protein [Acidobacteriota bacterium]
MILSILVVGLAAGGTARAADYRFYGPHVTAQAPWINTVQVVNNGDATGTFEITVRDGAGAVVHQEVYEVPPGGARRLVMSNFAGYVQAGDEVLLTPVEGTFVIDTDNPRLRPTVAFRYGDSVSLCEFFLADTLGWEFVLPNTVEDHFAWTGMSLMNPFDEPLTLWVEAYQGGVMVGQSEVTGIPPGTKHVRLSDGFWTGLDYTAYDQVRIYSQQRPFPPPMAITGNDAQDRHLFFSAAATQPAGTIYAQDSIVGDLMFVAARTFRQGAPAEEPCRQPDEEPFTHSLTRDFAVMATEVTRQMWADLRAAQPTLPADPSNIWGFYDYPDFPVQQVSWYQTLLFANLLSLEQGLTPCYYRDAAFTTLLTADNYTSNDVYCDWDADGYRLPTEGEWEYFCRAGTTTPFWVAEPAYTAATCDQPCNGPADFPQLTAAEALVCEFTYTTSVRGRLPNPWGVYDVHGNVSEWCWDWWAQHPAGLVTDYTGAASGSARAVRGGNCWEQPADSRSARRFSQSPDVVNYRYGFRLCRTIPGDAVHGPAYRYYGPHITAQAPWINKIQVLNNSSAAASFTLIVRDGGGQVAHQQTYDVPPTASRRLVMSNFAGYVPAGDEILLTPVEGTFVIETDNPRLRPTVAFRYGDSVSLCEFFLQDTLGWEFVLPNTVEDHFAWTGLSLMNPYAIPLTLRVEAFQGSALVGQSEIADIPPGTKHVRLSDGIWPDKSLGYTDFDQVRIYSQQRAFPPPMAITGNDAQDRHLFFNAASTQPAGIIYARDDIVGDLMLVPSGTFRQGSPADEPCRYSNEEPFTHTLSRAIAVMATELTRQMWNDLQAAQPSLPPDPSRVSYSGQDHPAQQVTWYQALLFANLLSVEQGLTPCYYLDTSFTIPLTAANYQTDNVFCDWDADGYRLPTEGEWEYFCRAGTTTPFWVDEPAFTAAVCNDWCYSEDTFPALCSVAVITCAATRTQPAMSRRANPWGLYDVHGNVWEWCWDWHGEYPTGHVADYRGPATGLTRASRGGSYGDNPSYVRSALHMSNDPNAAANNQGFRLCRTVQ